jgi:hypothetical protein
MKPRDKAVIDYLMLTTYQKRRQDGEIWAPDTATGIASSGAEFGGRPFLNSAPHGRERREWGIVEVALLPLPTFLPYRLAPFATALSKGGMETGGSLERLALLLRYVAGPLRWEPLNAYHHHFPAASPRSLTICDLYMAAYSDGSDTVALYRYMPDQHALAQVGTMERPSDARPGISFFIVGNLMRSARPYGDFSACIASLEAGGLAAQIAFMARAVGWSGPAPARQLPLDLRAELGLSHWSQVVLGQIDLEGCDVTTQLGELHSQSQRVIERMMDPEVEAFPRMRSFVEGAGAGSFKLGMAAEEGLPALGSGATGYNDDVLHVIRRRSSGLDNDGSPARAALFSAETLAALVADWRSLLSRCLTGDLATFQLSTFLAVLNGEPGVPGRYRLQAGAEGLERLGSLDPSQLRSFSSRQYWEGVSFVASVTVDPLAVLASCPHAPFAALHGAGGACGHAISLAAARRGMFARPVRAYTEFALNQVTPANEVMVLQLVCGYPGQGNLQFDLI